MEPKVETNLKSKGSMSSFYLQNQQIVFLLMIIVVIVAIAPIFAPDFFTTNNLYNLLRQITYTAIVSIGMLLVILIGGIDLSVGSIMQAVSLAAILLIQNQLPVFMIVLLVLFLGAFLGLINGTLITYGKLQPFIVTLSTKIIITGCILVTTQGRGVSGDISDSFRVMGTGYVGPVPISVIIMFVLFVVAYIVLHKTVFGRHIYSIGSNRLSAINAGINVNKVQLLVYSLSGVFAAIAGILVSSRTGAFQPVSGDVVGMELNAIAAVVVGGASLVGGKGTVVGAFLGALLAGLVFNLLVFLNMNPYIQQLILGVIILAAVIFSASKNK